MFQDFTAKAAKENTFTLTVENETLHEMSSDNGVLVLIINLAISDNLIVRDTTFPFCNIHEHTWTSSCWQDTQIDDSLVGRRQHSGIYDVLSLDEIVVILTSALWLQKLGKDFQ
jgi:hypothetical protein